jgi:hypothetical protein
MTTHIYTLTKTGPKGWKVSISPTTSYGYFEEPDGGEGGGLWFDGKNLQDYDGRSTLPRECSDLIVALGYHVHPCFYPDDYPSEFALQQLPRDCTSWVDLNLYPTLLDAEQALGSAAVRLGASQLRILSRTTRRLQVFTPDTCSYDKD